MPGLNGFELFQRMKQIPYLKETPVVFISGCATLENQQLALDVGAADYITKPFETFEFAPRLLSHIKAKTTSHFVAASESTTT